MTELHTAYVYALAHLANLGERSALKLKRLFATYDDWLAKAPSEISFACRRSGHGR